MAKGKFDLKGKKIAEQIERQIGSIILLIFLLIAIVSIISVRSIVVKSKQTELTLESQAASYQLADFFDQYRRLTEQLAVNPELRQVLTDTVEAHSLTKTKGYDTVFENMLNIAKSDSENILAVWIADLDANALAQSDEFTSSDGWYIQDRPWYYCMEIGQTIYTEPYVDASTGQTILSAVSPVYDSQGKVLGVAGVDITLNHVMEMMQEYVIGEEGFVMLMASSGLIIYHPNAEYVQDNLSNIDISANVLELMNEDKEAFLNYKAAGVSKYGYLSNIGETGYKVLSNLPSGEYYSTVVSMIIGFVFLFAVGIVCIIISMKKVSKKLTKPILELNVAAQKIAEGDLQVELKVESEDEIGELAQSIHKTIERLQEYIDYIDEISEVLADMSNGKLYIDLKHDYVGEFQKVKMALIHISDSFIEVMHGINDSADQVSGGADDLAKASQGLAEVATSQVAAVEALVATSTTILEQVEENRADAEQSTKEVRHVVDMMEGSQEQMNHMLAAMQKIYDTSHEVVGITQTIEEIAEQTNLLALNASIEAARAGEAGKGFAVVAGEISKLADQSASAVNTTRELINISIEEIERGNNVAKEVMESLHASVEAVERVDELIQKTTEHTVTQAQSLEQIRGGIEDISQGTQDNSAMSEESSATAQELASQAEMLSDMVSKFQLNP